jgi:hypothetical protein
MTFMKKALLFCAAFLMISNTVFTQTFGFRQTNYSPSLPLLTPLCGSYNVGAGQTYTTLTAAVNDLTSRGVSCAVTFILTDNAYPSETFPITIGTVTGTSYTNTVTIKPATGKTPLITGSSASAILMLSGCNYIIIDGSNSGGTDRSLTWANTSTAANTYSIEIINPGTAASSNDIIKNCQIKASSQVTKNTYGIYLDNTYGGYDSISIINNAIYSARIGIQFQGLAGAVVTHGQILENTIGSTTDAQAIQYRGIFLRQANTTIIQGNEIMGAPAGNANTLQAGIWIGAAAPSTKMRQNNIHDWYYTGTGGYANYGIYYGDGAGSATEISNNTITNIKADGNNSTQDGLIAGIYLENGGGISILYNSIWLTGATLQPTYNGWSACLSIYSGIGTLNIRDNIFKNSMTLASGSTGNTYAVYCASANTAFAAINFNDYYDDGVNPDIGYLGGNQSTLAAWQAATGQDANSLNIDPLFTGPNDLHTTVAGLAKAGVYVALVTVDITGVGRTNPPDIGAYQFSANPTATSNAATGVTSTTATLNGSITANNATVVTGFNYGLTTAYGTFIAGVPASVTGTTPTAFTGAVTGLVPATLYHFMATGTSGNVIVNGNDLTFTTLSNPPTVVTTSATGITATTGTLNGTVNANGASSTVNFDYGLTTAYGNNVPGVPGVVTGSTATPSSASLTGLIPATLYHFRINGINAGGTTNGNDMTFTTLAAVPTVVTNTATMVLTTSATLNGTVTANGLLTTVSFDYGLTTSYGTNVPGTPLTVTGSTATAVSANITGLLVNTTYHFRANGVNSMGTTNGNDLTFTTGCPQSGPAGPITGPSTVCQGGSGYVYTVTIPNAIGYVWTLPIGGTITSGNNTNTITVSYAYNSVPGYLMVYGTAPCGNGTPSQLYIYMNPYPIPTIAGPSNVCLNSTGNTYTTQSGMTNYLWTVTGGNITAGGGTANNTITVTWTSVGAKTVCVNYTNANGCAGLAPVCYNVTVNPLPTPTISGPSSSCSNVPGIVYSTQTGMTSYVWSITAGGAITGGAGTSSITVTWNTPGAQSVSVNYTNTNGCIAPAPTVYPVTVNSSTTPTITGSTSLCVNSGYYTYTTQSGMTNYVWNISSGGVINYGSGTNAITVSWVASGAQWVSVNFTNSSGCTVPNPTQLNVTVNPLPGAAGSITGTSAVCGGANGVAYSVATITGATAYVWTLPTGATIASGANTNSITVNFAWNASSGAIIVTGNNVCGDGPSSPPFNVTVTSLPDPAGTITGPASVCLGATGEVYTVPPIAGATTYAWTVPTGFITTSGSNTNSITVSISNSAVSGNITVFGSNSCGNGTVSPNLAVTVNPVPPAPVVTNTGTTLYSSEPAGNQWYYQGTLIPGATGQTYVATQDGYYWTVVTLDGCSSEASNHLLILVTGIDQHSSADINIYPVPNDGQFNVSITTTSEESFLIRVYNNLGIMIHEETKVQVDGSLQKVIDLRPVPDGVYTVIFENSQNQVVEKIVVSK